MDEEATDELVGSKVHGLVTAAALVPIVFPFEGYPVLIEGDETTVGDGDPVGVTREIGQYGGGSGKRAFGIDEPLALAPRVEPRGEHLGLGERGVFTEERELTGAMGRAELVEE